MDTVTSKDGTTIAFDRLGNGPPVILVSGGSVDRSSNAGLAEVLAKDFTVYNYDRRGRGPSGTRSLTRSSVKSRTSRRSSARRAARPPCTARPRARRSHSRRLPAGCRSRSSPCGSRPTSSTRTPGRGRHSVDLPGLRGQGDRGGAVEFFMAKVVGMPAEFVAGARSQPWWAWTRDSPTPSRTTPRSWATTRCRSQGRKGDGADSRDRWRSEFRVHGPDGRCAGDGYPERRAPNARGPGAQRRPERPRSGAEGVLRQLSPGFGSPRHSRAGGHVAAGASACPAV